MFGLQGTFDFRPSNLEASSAPLGPSAQGPARAGQEAAEAAEAATLEAEQSEDGLCAACRGACGAWKRVLR